MTGILMNLLILNLSIVDLILDGEEMILLIAQFIDDSFPGIDGLRWFALEVMHDWGSLATSSCNLLRVELKFINNFDQCFPL